MKKLWPIMGTLALLGAGAYGGYQFSQTQVSGPKVITAASSSEPTQEVQASFGKASDAPSDLPGLRGAGEAELPSMTPQAETLARTESENNTAAVVRSSSDGLVYIETTSEASAQEQMLSQMLGQRQPQPSEALGSGFFVTPAGDIITNYHVVGGASEVSIRVHGDATLYPADVIGTAPDFDLALIRARDLPPELVKPLPLGDDAQLEVGLKAIALGAPFGLDFSVSEGIISNLEREVGVGLRDVEQPVIQTDAAINPGNSGGPLLNSSGQVIGVNTQILTGGVGQSAGVGFAIPINTVKRLLPQLQAGEEVQTPRLGIRLGDLSTMNPDMLAAAGLPERGILVLDVEQGSPAEAAGLQAAQPTEGPNGAIIPRSNSDIIVAVDGEPLEEYQDLTSALIGKVAGETMQLTVRRGNVIKDIAVQLTDYTFE